jgi:hypothetical protein
MGSHGQMAHSEQQGAGLGVVWGPFRALGTQAMATVTVVKQNDGRLHAFGVGDDGQVYHTAQTSTGLNSEWTGWRSLPDPGDRAQNLAVVVGPDGRLHVFKTRSDGEATHAEEVVAGLSAPWTGWHRLSDRENTAKSLVAVTGGDGRVHVFRVGLDNRISHNEQVAACVNAPWSGWREVAAGGHLADDVVVAADQYQRLHAFAVGWR